MKPIIGVTLDQKEKGDFANRPYYAMESMYFKAIEAAGGIAIGLPHHQGSINNYVELCDGLLSPGGNFLCPDHWYEDPDSSGSPYTKTTRFNFDTSLISAFFKSAKPILGICAGMQLLGGLFGCKLTGDLHTRLKTNIDHLKGTPAREFAYSVNIEKESLLHKIIGQGQMRVNSSHQEAIIQCSQEVAITAKSPDNCIQAIEVLAHPFALGVQWHPEFFINNKEEEGHFKLFKALIQAASAK